MTTTPVTTAVPATSLTGRPSTRTAPWRSSNGRIWIGQSVLAVLYVMAAAPKLSNDPHMLAEFGRLGIGAAGMHTIGIVEVAGAIALLIPQLCGVAALAFVALMSGATGPHPRAHRLRQRRRPRRLPGRRRRRRVGPTRPNGPARRDRGLARAPRRHPAADAVAAGREMNAINARDRARHSSS